MRHIEKLRTQQQNARNNKEYQTFLIEINTAKVDRNKVEDETMKLLEQVKRRQQGMAELAARRAEQGKAGDDARSGRRDARRDPGGNRRDQARSRRGRASAVPAKAREMFDRMSDRFDGEAMSAIAKPDRRREEYVCTACNMDLVVDVYNKLHSAMSWCSARAAGESCTFPTIFRRRWRSRASRPVRSNRMEKELRSSTDANAPAATKSQIIFRIREGHSILCSACC